MKHSKRIKKNMKKLCILLVAASVLISCTPAPVDNSKSLSINRSADLQNASADSVIQSLLTASATDFHNHQPPVPVSFQNVRTGYLKLSNGSKQYIMCGQFLSQDKQNKDEWTPFATIITSDYEQWVGNQALVFCEDSTVIWVEAADLSTMLKNRLSSLQ
jgi:hypothetical protein